VPSDVQRTRASAAWPATRNGNALGTRQRSGPRPLQAPVRRTQKCAGESMSLTLMAILPLKHSAGLLPYVPSWTGWLTKQRQP